MTYNNSICIISVDETLSMIKEQHKNIYSIIYRFYAYDI